MSASVSFPNASFVKEISTYSEDICAHNCTNHTNPVTDAQEALSVSIHMISAQTDSGRDGVILASNQNLSMQQKRNPSGQTPTMRERKR